MNKETYLTAPDFLTVMNASLGFLSITYVIDDKVWLASVLIIFSVTLDGIDGALARYLGVEHELGTYLDAFADVISFCFAPAILLYYTYFDQTVRGWQSPQNALATVVSFLVVFLGTMRLARFVDKTSKAKTYNGLPTAILAMVIIHFSYLLEWGPIDINLPYYYPLGIIGVLSLLLYTSIKYPKFRTRKTKAAGAIFLILTFSGFLLTDFSQFFGIILLLFTTSLLLGYVFISPFILKIYERKKREYG